MFNEEGNKVNNRQWALARLSYAIMNSSSNMCKNDVL